MCGARFGSPRLYNCNVSIRMDSVKESTLTSDHEPHGTIDQKEEEAAVDFEEDSDLKKNLDEWKTVAEERPLRIMVCGLGGVGKSTLINQLLQLESGEKWAEEGKTGNATTSIVSKYEKTTGRGIKVCLFDTPGFDDINITNEKIIAMMDKATEKKLDVTFYCISLEGSARVQQGDVRAIKLMTQVFGEDIWKKAVMVLTFANDLEEKSSIDRYRSVVRSITENLQKVLSKEHVHDDIIKELPILTAGYHTNGILRYEAEECKNNGGWDNRLFLAALKQVDPAVLPALLEVRFSWKDLGVAFGGGGSGAAMGAGVGALTGAILGPAGVVAGAAVGAGLGAAFGAAGGAGAGVLAYQFFKIKSILKIKYIKWKLNRIPASPYQATSD